jgi:hypothetical protein
MWEVVWWPVATPLSCVGDELVVYSVVSGGSAPAPPALTALAQA